MKRIIPILLLIPLTILLAIGAYKLCFLIAEKHFFDKFFYYKSTRYGYWIPHQTLAFSDFGERGKFLEILLNSNQSQILGAITDKKKFKIIVFGDSFTWGQGIKNEERFVKLLEDKLNLIRPTQIISLAQCGDNIFDHYAKFIQSKMVFGLADLYIFALYNNDLLFNKENPYNTTDIIFKYYSYCPGTAVFDIGFDPEKPPIDTTQAYLNQVAKTFNPSTKNVCIFKKIASLLPKQNTIYIDLGKIDPGEIEDAFSQIIKENLPTFEYSLGNVDNSALHISQRERHPSVKANQIFSQVLFQEITTNPFWKFTK